jgi:CBS domain-containing protein
MKPVRELLRKHDGTLWHVTPEMTVYDAVERLAHHDAGALLVMVVNGDRVLGMISIRDIMNDIIADHESTIAALQGYITW